MLIKGYSLERIKNIYMSQIRYNQLLEYRYKTKPWFLK